MATNIEVFREAWRTVNGTLQRVMLQLDYFTYTLEATTLAAAGTAIDTINIQADADFYVTSLGYMADIAGALQTDATRVIPLVRATINDTGSGRNLSDQAVDLSNMGGTGGLPYELPVPRLFTANSTIQCTFTSYAVAGTTYANVRLYLNGYKAWVYDGPRLLTGVGM